ncbi:DUF4303 domain-containing protein [Blastopirellula sp. JC732]|uniref:DUF4303 domain-containing protein n=1 Tax=Blastopirellula sediminis TaxID=2894196 RepID=A0A9X1SHQ1_9BACT|nr:DUF4303 domain-containing protein [Blastopirellula sediminis]MCC9606662.1 DUF4303 domain-containing protein [Blastopirellula sediminis]MCC9630041.1 DUF4303 domain-containing protein [Blastopirellula sediminis]
MASQPELVDLFYDAAEKAFAAWRAENPTETVFAFVLSTIDDAIYVSGSVNSLESHERRLAERGYDASHEYAADTKWGPWEWENEYIGSEYFQVADQRLGELSEEMGEKKHAKFKKTVTDSMVEALVRLRNSGAISNPGDPIEIALFATIYDSCDAEGLQRRSGKLLNSPELCAEFLEVING